MKILIINYHYPPSGTAHSYRWSQLTERFRLLGHDVDIIAGGNSGELDRQLNVTRVNFPMTVRSSSNLSANPTGHSAATEVKFSLLKDIKSYILLITKRMYRSFFWPDGLWHWLPMALIEVYKRRNVKYDLVIGYSPTYSALLAAKYYKRLNSEVTLIVDFGDPFSTSKEMPVNNYTFYKNINKRSENKVFQVADLITVTNQQTAVLYREAHPQINKFKIVPHLVDVDAFYSDHVCSSPSVKIGYIGAFHKGIREPYLALDVLNKLSVYISDLQADFYGPLNGIEFRESKKIKHLGVVERDKAILLTKEFDIIINVENEACPMTPSKIYECMASGKPILNFLSSTNTSSFIGYPLVINISPDTNVAKIAQFINLNSKKRLMRSTVDKCLEGKTLASVADMYLTK